MSPATSSSPNPPVRRAIGAVTAIVVAAGSYAVDPAPTLAAFVGLSFGASAWLVLRNRAVAPELTDGGWPGNRWSALTAGFTTAAALIGVQPLFDSVRGLTLPLLVIGVGFTTAQFGVASVVDVARDDAGGGGTGEAEEPTPSTR